MRADVPSQSLTNLRRRSVLSLCQEVYHIISTRALAAGIDIVVTVFAKGKINEGIIDTMKVSSIVPGFLPLKVPHTNTTPQALILDN